MKPFMQQSRETVACQTEANLRGSTGIGNAGIMNPIQAPHKDPRVAKTLPGVQVARVLIALLLLLPVVAAHGADAKPDAPDLVSGFRSPPQAAKPLVWWHWINGNVTKEGIEDGSSGRNA